MRVLFPEGVEVMDVIFGEPNGARILIGLFVRKSENIKRC